ncbi:MAG: methyltransferase, partial [Pseudomonadota bacterium]
MFDLCNGFVYSQILHACVRLDLLTALQERSRTIDEIADLTDLPRDGAGRLVRAAVALDILEPRSRDRFGLGEAGAAVLGSPGLQGMILHHEHFYEDLSDIVALLKGRSKSTALANYWLYSTQANGAPSDRTVMATYSELMRETQTQLADEILRAYPFKGHQHLMDVGGGDGAFLCEVHSRLPQLKLSLFDLPNVIDLARPRLEALSVPVTPHSGDMFADAWPNSADVISLIRVCLDHDDDKVRVLLKRARAALKPGGVLLIAEPM